MARSGRGARRHRRRRIGAGLVVTALLIAGCGGQGPAEVSAADLGLDTAAVVAPNGKDPTATIDPASGTIYVIWAQGAHGGGHERHGGGETNKDHGVYLASSTDGGATFSTPARVSPAGRDVASHSGGPPQVAVGTGGEVYVAWEQDEPYPGMEYGRSDVLFARSTDGGQTFDQPRTVVQGEGVVSTSFFDLFTADNGRVWVGFLDYRAEIGGKDHAPVQIRVVHSDDGGVTFSRSAVVHELSCECCRVDFATQGEQLLLGWRQIYPRGQFPGPQDPVRDVAVARSTDGGASWGLPSKLHDDQWVVNQCPHSGPVMHSDSRGALHAAWYTGAADHPGVYYASAAQGQQALGEPRALFAGQVNPAPVPSLAVDGADRTWITWETAPQGQSQVHAARVSPDGALEVVAKPLAAGTVPRVASGAGRVVLVWAAPDGIHTLAGELDTAPQ